MQIFIYWYVSAHMYTPPCVHCRNSQGNKLYERMWQYMESTADIRVPDAKEGVRRVRESFAGRPYAFITEGSTADFWVNQQPCDLTRVTVTMSERGYALAVKKNWPTGDSIDAALGRLEQSGALATLRQNWWTKGGCASSSSGGRRATGGGDVAATGVRLLMQLAAAILVATAPTFAANEYIF